jgi:5-methylcytosine-specific restriction enzyme A
MLRPCVDYGEISEAARCPQHARDLKPSRHERGYGNAWARLSKRARRRQPWCSDCGSQDDLTVDHSPEAWERHEAGLEITLDLVTVVCRSCNGRRGRARPMSDEGRVPAPQGSRTPGVAKSESVLGLQELNVDLVGSFRRGVLNPRPRRGRDMPTLSPLVEDQKTIVPNHVGTIVVILARDGAGFLKSNLESHVHESFMKDGARHLSTVEPLGTTLRRRFSSPHSSSTATSAIWRIVSGKARASRKVTRVPSSNG